MSRQIIGVMSGTSLDGIDLACCSFSRSKGGWTYQIHAAETIPYSAYWSDVLASAHEVSALELIRLHHEYGKYLGKSIKVFSEDHHLEPALVGSHGHTIFHQPDKGFTFQLGSGQGIAQTCGITTVADFRTDDVLNGGQGAPFAPVGDKFLFRDYPYCINLGGFSNISFEEENAMIAFDICPVNFILNAQAQRMGYDYDKDGKLAEAGTVNADLLELLNDLDYYKQKPPKSLGREWIEERWKPLVDKLHYQPGSMLATFTQHIADQISFVLSRQQEGKVLLTGGGAKNDFLIELLRKQNKHEIVVPEEQTIDYKEALIFAFMAQLRIENQTNVMASVTGGTSDISAGTIFQA